jgi:hypothetical protein
MAFRWLAAGTTSAVRVTTMTSRPTDRASLSDRDLAKVNQELLGATWEKGWPGGREQRAGDNESSHGSKGRREGTS